MSAESAASYLERQFDRVVGELEEFLRVPSVSARSEHAGHCRRAAEWAAAHLRRIGLSSSVEETGGHPAVVAEWLGAPGAPTVLVYGHYDVQPVDPLREWSSDPFSPARVNGHIYARGATDDKGQLFTHFASCDAWLRGEGRLPLNVKFFVEGEEEIGCPNTHRFVERRRERLACDLVVVSDGFQFAPGVPAVTYGLRGIAYYEIAVRGPSRDLHSGVFGGTVANPALGLARALGELVDAQGRVRVPGFYDDVVPLTEEERTDFAALPFDERAYLAGIGAGRPFGEEGFTTLERRWARPTCDVSGLWGGYAGEGVKTIIPSSAGAKVTFRLVPRQNPARIAAALSAFLAERLPPGLLLELRELDARPATLFARGGAASRAAAEAIRAGFGRPPVFIREGSSVPIVNAFRDILGAESLLLGWGLPESNVHSPNENLSIEDFRKAARASLRLWEELAKGVR